LYDRNDGIAGTPLSSYSTGRPVARAGDGRLWFVTGGGLSVIDPQAMTLAASLGPARIEGVIADGTALAANPATVLPPRTSSLQIDYSLVNLTTPFRTNFRYRLEGFDTAWIDAGTRRQAFYTNLPPRKYRFSLAASNLEGAPLSTATWDFSIAPTFYQTGWFYAASATAFVLALGGAWYLYLRRVRRDFALLLGERTRLSREIHDTLLQSLVGVALQFEAIASDVETASPVTRAQFVRMRKRVEEYIREARQSIWNLRSPRLEQRDLATALNEFGTQATSTTKVGFDLVVDGTPSRRPPRVEEQLLRIGQEAIMNAVRHARASLIKVELQYDDEAVVLRVTDDGTGFNVESQSGDGSGHYGLISMKERAGEAGGTIKVASSAGSGTRVTVAVPVARQPWNASHADA
jgi:signal transduction histidine kinase